MGNDPTRAKGASERAKSLRERAREARERDDFPETERLARRAAEVAAAEDDERGRVLAVSIAASAQFRQGRLASAEESLRSALSYEPELGRTLNNLALVVAHRGRPAEALDLYDQALTALGGRIPRHDAIALNNMGMLFERLGLLAEALEVYELALERLNGIDGPGIWRTRMNITNNQGVVMRKLGRLGEAADYDRRTLEVARANGDRRGEASAEHNLAAVAARQGRTGEAEARYQRALNLRAQYGDPAEQAVTLHNLARLRSELGRFDEAVALFDRTHRLRISAEDPAGEVQTLVEWGRALTNLGQRGAARNRYEQAQCLVERMRQEITSEEMRRIYVATVGDLYGELAVLVACDGDIEYAFATAEAGRARVLRERLAASPETRDSYLLQRERELLDELAVRKDSDDATSSTERQVEARRELARIQSQLRRSPALEISPSALDEAVADLPEGTRLGSFVLGEARSFVFVLDAGTATLHELPARRQIESNVERFQTAIRTRSKHPRAGAWLYRKLFQPLASDHRDGRYVLVGDGALHDLAWSALPHPDGGYLVEHASLSIAPASNLRSGSGCLSDEYRAELVAFAAPADGGDAEQISPTGVPRVRARVQPIPRTVEEVLAIAEHVARATPPDRVVVRVREAATREELVKVLREHTPVRFVHLACHGLIVPDAPALSGVALTASDGCGVEVWRAPQILHSDLRCELAVLSACDTAAGPVVPGEGVASLGQALRAAGAQHALVALWAVNDDAAPELMRRLYAALIEGESVDAALAQAQRQMLATSHSHPFDWAWAVAA